MNESLLQEMLDEFALRKLVHTYCRAVDRGEWLAMSKAMADAGMTALKATQAKDPAGVLAAGEAINMSCDNCHRKYQRG